jgi:hypothetical protein
MDATISLTDEGFLMKNGTSNCSVILLCQKTRLLTDISLYNSWQ